MRKLLLPAVTLTAAALALAGCSSSNETGTSPTDAATGGSTTAADGGAGGDLTIALIAKANASDYWTAVKNGAMKAGEELGVKVTFNGPDTESEGDKQLNMLQTAVNNAPAGIGFAPQDGAQDGAPSILDQAKAAGIPVVAFDTPVNSSDVPLATVASDNKGIGKMAADNMAKLIGAPGEVAIIAHGEVGTAADRRDGFKAEIESLGYTVVDIQNGESDQAKSQDKAQAILQAHPNLVGFFGTDDDSAIGIANQVESKGLSDQVVVVGVDASPDEISLVKSGQIDGGVTQNPANIGYKAVQILVAAARGTNTETGNIVSESVWYTASNLDDPDVKAVIGG